jgi:hypothetical protein
VNNRVGTALAVVRQALDAVGLTDVGLRAVARNRPSLRWSAGQRVRQLRLF